MKIKKICFILITLFIININIVKAENVKVGDTTYFIGKEFYCNGEKMEFEMFIEKTNKIVVSDSEDNNFIWREDGVCTAQTQQDILDSHDYPSEDFEENSNKFTITSINFDYMTAYIRPTVFDENETYYSDMDGTVEVQNPTEENISSYYKRMYVRRPKTTEINPNETYYKHKTRNVVEVADISEVNENNISDYYILTSMEEINEVKTVYTMDRTLYDSLVGASDTHTFRRLDGNIYLVVANTNTIKYYDLNGVETPIYNGYIVTEFNNYLYMLNSSYNQIIIKDKASQTKIYEYTYNSSIMHFSANEIGNNFLIYDFDSNGIITTYIVEYELLEGANQIYDGNDITIKTSGNYDTFKELRINNEIVSKNNYTVSKGSTIIKINKDYLNTLKSGVNNVSVIYKNGAIVSTKLTINNVINPQTGDNLNSYIFIGIISLLGILLSNNIIKKYLI